MFRHLLAAGVAAAGIGLAGNAEPVQARDHHHGHHHHHGQIFNGRHHHGRYFSGRNRFHVHPYRHFGHSHFRRGYYGGRGYYGAPYYGNGFFIGTNGFQLGVWR